MTLEYNIETCSNFPYQDNWTKLKPICFYHCSRAKYINNEVNIAKLNTSVFAENQLQK